MRLFDSAARNGRASLFGLIANAAFLTGVACVAGAMLLDRLTSGPNAPLVALFSPGRTPSEQQLAQGGLRQTSTPGLDQFDTTPTASLQRPMVFNPCAATSR